MKITHLQQTALERLHHLHERTGSDMGFHAVFLGSNTAATLRRMEPTGLVKIERQAENCFRYSLTESGFDHISKAKQVEAVSQ